MPWILGVSGLVVIVLVTIAVAKPFSAPAASAAPSLPISNQMSNLLEVNPLMTLDTTAPAVQLTDQNGRATSLSQFRGKAVILTFGDDKCTDLCTLLAQDVLTADKDLGSSASNIQFVSVNANRFYPSVASVKEWTDQHGLAHTANWHFLTGSTATLKTLANRYGVEVDLDQKTKTIVHGAEMYFIDPAGKEIQIGEFGVQSANTALFSHAMAQLAVDTLPAGDQHTVTGPKGSASKAASTALGSTPPPVELPALASGAPTSTASFKGHYVVLNFWSSTCTACVAELPAIQAANKNLAGQAVIVGIDVSDPTAAASAFVRRAGTSYLMLRDSSGTTAGQYQITGLPYTVILSPNGSVVVRHPGSMTAEQLEYLIQTLVAQGN
jgi:cytochrome oxidase Cu insertion factor (SCO1/SenC/PrrC family)